MKLAKNLQTVKVSVVFPAYNESDTLEDSVCKLIQNLDNITSSYERIIAEDGSTDGTEDVLTTLCSYNKDKLLSITLPKNEGKASAVRKGFHKAFELRQFDYVGYWDADLATPLYAIDDFYELFDSPQINIVMGARVLLLNRKIERFFIRHYLGRCFATLASLVLGVAVYDTQCGAKLFRNNSELQAVF